MQVALPADLADSAPVQELPRGAHERFLEIDEGFLNLQDFAKIFDLLHFVVVVLRRRLDFSQSFRRLGEVVVILGKMLQVIWNEEREEGEEEPQKEREGSTIKSSKDGYGTTAFMIMNPST